MKRLFGLFVAVCLLPSWAQGETTIDLDTLGADETIVVDETPIVFRFQLWNWPSAFVLQSFQSVKSGNTITIERVPSAKPIPAALRITAAPKNTIFAWLRSGVSMRDIPFFGPGTGMAAAGRYDYLILNEDAHHYVLYHPAEPAMQRADLVEETDAHYTLEWQVVGLRIDGEDQTFGNSTPEIIYLAVLRDSNFNGTVDDGEYTRLTLQFPAAAPTHP